MDIERRRRLKKFRIFLAEFIMFIGIIIVMGVLVAMANGWRINKNLEIEQNGLVQIESIPTDATVKIDKETLFQKTNTSKMLMAGQYRVNLSKEGYDSWSKDIKVSPGWLSRVRGVRLIRQDRKAEQMREYSAMNFFSTSSDREYALYSTDNTTKWQLASIRGDEMKISILDISKLFGQIKNGIFEGEVKKIVWGGDGSRLIVESVMNEKTEYVVIDVRDFKRSVNISNMIYKFEDGKFNNKQIKSLKFMDKEHLLGLIGSDLYKIDLSSGEIELIKEKIYSFHIKNEMLIYLSMIDNKVGVMKSNKEYDYTDLSIDTDKDSKVATSGYSSDGYLAVVTKNKFYIYKVKDFFTSDESTKQLLIEANLDFTPNEDLEVSNSGQFIMAKNGESVVVFDAESGRYFTYNQKDSKVRFLDDFNLYEIENGNLYIKDADGSNKRLLVEKNILPKFDVIISANNKWLYYVSNEEKVSIKRERILD